MRPGADMVLSRSTDGFTVAELLAAVFVIAVGLVYYLAPNERARFRDVWVGAVVTGLLWFLNGTRRWPFLILQAAICAFSSEVMRSPNRLTLLIRTHPRTLGWAMTIATGFVRVPRTSPVTSSDGDGAATLAK